MHWTAGPEVWVRDLKLAHGVVFLGKTLSQCFSPPRSTIKMSSGKLSGKPDEKLRGGGGEGVTL